MEGNGKKDPKYDWHYPDGKKEEKDDPNIVPTDYLLEGEKPSDNINVIERQKHIEVIFQLLVSGHSGIQIVKYCQSKLDIQSDRTVYRYIAKAKQRILEYNQPSLRHNLAWHIAHRMNMLRKAVSDGERGMELEIAKDLARLQGLYSDKFELIVKDEALYTQKANELLKKIREVPFEEIIDEFGDRGNRDQLNDGS